MDEKDIERLFEKKIDDVNFKNQIQQLKSELRDTTAKNEQLKMEFNELKYFVENAEPCPGCNKLVLSDSHYCKYCDAEFEKE